MKLSLRFAIRYTFTFRSFHFINFIAYISVAGIIIGVAALICVMSIFNGFREFAERQLISFDPHIRISGKNSPWLNNADSLLKIIKSDERIAAISSFISGKGLIFKGKNMQPSIIYAVQPGEIQAVSGVANSMIFGKFNLENAGGLPRIALGSLLADNLRAIPGDTIQILSPQSLETSLVSYNSPVFLRAVVCGLFQSNDQQYDQLYSYLPFRSGTAMFGVPPNSASGLDIRLKSFNDTEEFVHDWRKRFDGSLQFDTWYDLHKDLYNVMQFERLSTFLILSLIIVIAAFNILASLTMTVVEKTSDIALLKALGSSDGLIRGIFRNTGLFIGTLSSTLGTILGIGLCFGQIHYKWFRLDTSKYLIDSIPVSLHFIDTAAVFILTLILSYLTTVYPASRVSKVNISQTLREY